MSNIRLMGEYIERSLGDLSLVLMALVEKLDSIDKLENKIEAELQHIRVEASQNFDDVSKGY